ncbi:MAG: CHAT domain-containing protein, partial [Microcoleaceae cyanobacterium]
MIQITADLQVRVVVNNAPTINNLDNSPPLEISLGNNVAESLAIGNTAEAAVFIDNAVSGEFEGQLNTEFNNNFETVEQVQDTLGQIAEETGKKPGIVYVMARPEQLDLVLVTPDKGQIIYRTVYDAERKIVLQKANDLRAEITNQRKRNSNSYLPLAQQMYNWIIAPIAKDLQDLQIDTIAFVLDSGLRTLPIAVLHDGEGFIIEKFSVGLIPSINLVDTKYRSVKDASILAMGASQFQEFSPLPAVPIEISTITQDWQGISFLNKDFTLENLRNSRTEYPYRIIHLAT